jgi:thymidylate synthase
MLLEMIAQQVNMVPGELIGNLGDTHIYSNHIEQIKEQLKRESKECNHKLVLNKAKDIFSYQFEDFKIEGYEAHPSIKMPIAV